ncbi:hypothetical protein F7734_06345 [Scytonema sp. UIC 10036]|uniref:hypothetical protein n=1 Tax=Scytonema sp. UIC 10036 TaxID=2304196 RepID=UPI0012DA17C8|nr:hypothetical protein [Scytonema sp. UIC 10036]MUG92096.1 hypothetical protein [Scytonema sp. UIC 10036]
MKTFFMLRGRRKFIIAGLSGFLTTFLIHPVASVLAVDKQIDRRTYSDATENQYYLVFCARGGSPTGHAFIIWGVEDNNKLISAQEAFGFYPSQGTGVFGSVPGSVKDEALSEKMNFITDRLIVQVDKTIFERAQKAISKWSTADYNLFSNNCINFVIDVARDAGLQVPSKSGTVTPSGYVQNLIYSN